MVPRNGSVNMASGLAGGLAPGIATRAERILMCGALIADRGAQINP